MNKKAIGQKLKALRGDKTMKEVAADVGISISALGMYETGQRVPTDNIKLALAKYYKTTVEAIFFA
jgi:transcriptional regulator with XRE-family HTH domain